MATTSTSTKLTNRIALEYAIKLVRNDDSWCDKYDPDEVINKLESMINALDKKAATPRKPTATQVENEAFAAEILSYLTAVDQPKSIKELQSEVASLAPLSNQRISHILSALVEKEKLEKSYVKKTPFFSVK